MKKSLDYALGEVVLCFGTYFGEPIGYGFVVEKVTGYGVHSFKLDKVIRMHSENLSKVIINDEEERFTDY